MKKRNYLPESNGLYKVNMKEPVSKATIRKRILSVICLIIFGFIMFQQLSNYFGNRRIKSNFSSEMKFYETGIKKSGGSSRINNSCS